MTTQPRILIVAYPSQGHLNPALRFATRLLNMGVHVTFSTSLSVVRRIQKDTTHHALTFAPFSDGHDNGKQPDTTMNQFVSDFATKVSCALAEIFTSAAAAGRPFDHLVYTTLVPWAAPVANAHGIKSTVLWCQSATMMDIYYYYFNDYQALISGNNNNPTFPINLPGLPPLTVADLPSFLRPSPKEDDFALPVLKGHVDALEQSPRILVNTFYELEIESIRAIEKFNFFPIGPLIPSEFFDSSNNSSGKDFFKKPEDDCIQWLNTKQKSSVVYVSFGSIASLSMDQEEEIAIGLLESGRPFLWVIRESGKAERLSKIEELKKQGMIVDWCSQVEVLSHQAIGCFLTHCGWNSTTEALVAGVPMVVFPQWSDQATNGKMIEDVWKTGVRVRRREEDGMGEGREVERCLQKVMGDGEMAKNAVEWSKLAKEAVNNGGSSIINLQAFLDDLK